MTILITILMFGLLIFVHELGHFTVAKWADVKVFEFSLGMGPKIFSFTKGETDYSLRLFPIGGFVRMAGENGADEEDENNKDDFVEDERSLNNKSIPVRMAVLSAGSFMNLVLGAVLFVGLFMFIGIPSNETVIGKVLTGRPAAQAGLMAGDKIIEVNGKKIAAWQDLTDYIHKHPLEKITFSIIRNNQPKQITIKTIKDAKTGFGLVGIEQTWKSQGIFTSLKLGFINTFEFTRVLLVALFKMITGQLKPEFAGPIGVTKMVGQAAQYGLANVLSFIAMFSLNLAVLNMLPIPALDGSRVALLILEGLRGKPLDPEKEGLIHLIGFALLILLMIIVTYQDIIRAFG